MPIGEFEDGIEQRGVETMAPKLDSDEVIKFLLSEEEAKGNVVARLDAYKTDSANGGYTRSDDAIVVSSTSIAGEGYDTITRRMTNSFDVVPKPVVPI